MNLNDYQKWTDETAIYPNAGTGNTDELLYLTVAAFGELGEIANKVKKLARDGESPEKRQAISTELGDVMWYIARLATALDISLEDLLKTNHDHLMNRKSRGVLKGDGDER